MGHLSMEERETVIRKSAADKIWDIVTADPAVIRYLEKRGYVSNRDSQFSDPYRHFEVESKRLRFLTKDKRQKGGFRSTDNVIAAEEAINNPPEQQAGLKR